MDEGERRMMEERRGRRREGREGEKMRKEQNFNQYR